MIPPIFRLAGASTEVTERLGVGQALRVYRAGRAPDDVVPPYVTWSIVSDAPAASLDADGPAHCRVQTNVWGRDGKEADDIDAAIRAAITDDGENVDLGLTIDEVDQATGLYRMSRDFSLWMT